MDCGFKNIYRLVKNFFLQALGQEGSLVKRSQALDNSIKKSSLFCFCRMFVTSLLKDLFLSKRPDLHYNSELSSINTAWDFSREHWSGDLITFESFFFLEFNCVCLKYLVQSSKWRAELSIWEVIFFPVPQEVVQLYIPFWCVIFWIRGFGLWLSFYLSVPDMDFLLYIHLFCPIWSYRE